MKQVHSVDVCVVREVWDQPPKGDALVTDRPNLLLGIVTADCAPVLLADRAAGVVGAAHAGWRGAHGGILENTVAAMVDLGAKRSNIVAAIGPTIAQDSYEVDEAFRAEFDGSAEQFFSADRPGHFTFDLPSYVASRLREAGLEHITDLREDTYSQPERFHSYRRATHRGGSTEGRQISIIGLSR